MTRGRNGSMAARGKLPDAVQRKVAKAVKTHWPDAVFDNRSQIGGGDMRVPHLKNFRFKEQFGNAIDPLPEHGGF